MARPLRIEFPGAVYHVTSRGLERGAIVRDDDDRARWLDLLDRVVSRYRWRVYAFALMDNHAHLFLTTPQANLSAGMHDLNSGYATGFNRRHRRVGPLFQGRFKAVVVEPGRHEWELSRYVHLNPVRAGLTADPEAWPWSSCRCYFRARLAPAWLAWQEVLAAHGRTLRTARRHYRQHLLEGVADPPRSPLEDVVASSLLGSPGFVERMRARLAGLLPDREVPALRALRPEPSIETIEGAVCEACEVEAQTLRWRGRHGNEPRRLAIVLARELTTLPLRDIGARFGGIGPAAVSNIVGQVAGDRRCARRLARLRRRLLARGEQ
jgi:REP element-mobilizing transposase RayT